MPIVIKYPGTYLTVKEYAEAHSLTIGAVYKAIDSGRLPNPIKIHKRWYIPAKSVMIDRRIKHGKYIGIRQFIAEGTDIRKGEKRNI